MEEEEEGKAVRRDAEMVTVGKAEAAAAAATTTTAATTTAAAAATGAGKKGAGKETELKIGINV